MTKQEIKSLYTEAINIHRGCITMMLNRADGNVWNDFFIDTNSYKFYAAESIVKIPIDHIIYLATTDHPLEKSEIIEAIYEWCEKECALWIQ